MKWKPCASQPPLFLGFEKWKRGDFLIFVWGAIRWWGVKEMHIHHMWFELVHVLSSSNTEQKVVKDEVV